MLALDAERSAGAAVLVADLGDHRRHAGVVGLELLLRPREVIANGDAVAHLRRVALAEDLALHVDVHLAPGVGLRARRDAAGQVATVARLLDGSDHSREGLVRIGSVARFDDQVLALVVDVGLTEPEVYRNGLSHGSGGQQSEGGDGKELLQHENLTG